MKTTFTIKKLRRVSFDSDTCCSWEQDEEKAIRGHLMRKEYISRRRMSPQQKRKHSISVQKLHIQHAFSILHSAQPQVVERLMGLLTATVDEDDIAEPLLDSLICFLQGLGAPEFESWEHASGEEAATESEIQSILTWFRDSSISIQDVAQNPKWSRKLHIVSQNYHFRKEFAFTSSPISQLRHLEAALAGIASSESLDDQGKKAPQAVVEPALVEAVDEEIGMAPRVAEDSTANEARAPSPSRKKRDTSSPSLKDEQEQPSAKKPKVV